MSKGSIIERKGKKGVSYLLKYDAGPDPVTGKRRQRYKTVGDIGIRKAQDELAKLVASVAEGDHVDPSKITLAQWIETWLGVHAAPNVSAKPPSDMANFCGNTLRLAWVRSGCRRSRLRPSAGCMPIFGPMAAQSERGKRAGKGRRPRRDCQNKLWCMFIGFYRSASPSRRRSG